MSLKAVALETINILRAGQLTTASRIEIDFSIEQQAAETPNKTLYPRTTQTTSTASAIE